VKISRRNKSVSFATTLKSDVEELARLISKTLNVEGGNAVMLAYLALYASTPE